MFGDRAEMGEAHQAGDERFLRVVDESIEIDAQGLRGRGDDQSVAAAADEGEVVVGHEGCARFIWGKRHVRARVGGAGDCGKVAEGGCSGASIRFTMKRVRIAAVRYLNTAPLIEGLEKLRDIELLPSVPARIVGMLADGSADIGLASVVDAVQSPVPLCCLPVGMIGCDGPTLTVRVFSTVPLDQITELHADEESHTSVILAQVLLWRLYGIRPKVVGFAAQGRSATSGQVPQQWPNSVLLIGDKVVTDAPSPERYQYQLDLGAAWKELTGMPFVYAVWMCRAGEEGEAHIRAAASVLDRQRRHNVTRLDWLVGVRAAPAGWPGALAREYLGSLLRYQVGVREMRAAEYFLECAAELGLIGRRSVAWAALPSEQPVVALAP